MMRILQFLTALVITYPASSAELFQTPLYNDPSLVSYWRFEGSANDSKNLNNGTQFNVAFGTSYGKFGQGANFNGSTSKIVTPSGTLSDSLTWSFWIRLTSSPGANGSVPLAQTDSAGRLGKYVVIFNDGSLRYTSPPGRDNRTAPGLITTNIWHHIAITVGAVATDLHIYIDGVDTAFTSTGLGAFSAGPIPYTIGAGTGAGADGLYGYWWPGDIDDVAVFSRGLTLAEIVQLQTTGSTANTLFITSAGANRIFTYYQSTGASIGPFADSTGYAPYGLAFGRDGYLYTATQSAINRFDPVTGELLASFGSFPGTRGMTIGPDGLIYVSVHDIGQIWRYNPTTSSFVDVFVGSIPGPTGLTFGPDGNLYAASHTTDSILKFSGTTGAYIATLVTDPGLSPYFFVFRSGYLYVGGEVYLNQVRRYVATTGAFDKVFATSPDLLVASSLTFGPDGKLYVASSRTASVLRFDGTTGAFIDTFIPAGSGGLSINITAILFPVSLTVPTTGTITVSAIQGGQPLNGAPFTLTKDGVFFASSTTPYANSSAPPGAYRISYVDVPGYTKPPDETKILAAGGIISFSGNYVPSLPSLNVFPLSLSFNYQQGVNGFILPKPLLLTSSGAALSFTAMASTIPPGASWLSVLPNSGTTISTLFVSVSPALSQGTYFGQIIITAAGAANSPQVIPITLTVAAPVPRLYTILPTFGAQGTTLPNVAVNGADFQFGARVLFSGSGVTSTPYHAEPNQLIVSVVIAPDASVGPRDVIVRNPNGEEARLSSGFSVRPPASIVLTPSSASLLIGNQQSINAAIVSVYGTPLAGISITFNITGTHPSSFTTTTDKSGVAEIRYKGSGAGLDSVIGRATISGVVISSQPALIKWLSPQQTVKPLAIKLPADIWKQKQDLNNDESSLRDGIFTFAKEEAIRLSTGYYEDPCYFGAITSVLEREKHELIAAPLKDLARSIASLTLGLITANTVSGDLLLMAGRYLIQVTGTDNWGKDTLVFFTEESIGYMLTTAASEYVANPFSTKLSDTSEKTVEAMLKYEDVVSIFGRGGNDGSPYLTSGAPAARAEFDMSYNPYSRYVTGGIRAVCRLSNSSEVTRYYVFRYKANKDGYKVGDATIVSQPQ